MKTVININFIVFAVIGAVVVAIGLDLKRWTSWLYGIYGFLTGFISGLMWSNLSGGLLLGLLLASAVLYGGATTYWHKQRFRD